MSRIYWHAIKWLYQPSKQTTDWIKAMKRYNNEVLNNIEGKDNKFKKERFNKILAGGDIESIQKIYSLGLKEAIKEVNKGSGFDTKPPVNVPKELIDPSIFFNRDIFYKFLMKYMKPSYCMDENKVYDTVYYNK